MSTTNHDKLVDELIEVTQQRQKDIQKAEKPTWNTNCTFVYENSSLQVNLRTITDVKKLVSILAYIIDKEKSFKLANAALETKETFDYNGYSVSEWTEDIKTRINVITLAAKRKELAEIEAQLDALISPERRMELQLTAIKKKLLG